MESVVLFDDLPSKWTYPLIQPLLIAEYGRRKNMCYLENYYNNHDEENRLVTHPGQIEYLTTMKYINDNLE